MYKWYLKQKLLIKLVMPSIIITTVLIASGCVMIVRVIGQQTLQKEYQQALLESRDLAEVTFTLGQTQASLFKAVSLAFAGLSPEKAGADLKTNQQTQCKASRPS